MAEFDRPTVAARADAGLAIDAGLRAYMLKVYNYMGIGLDPVDTGAIWVHTQFASGTDAYKTWIGMTKMAPVPGKFIFLDRS